MTAKTVIHRGLLALGLALASAGGAWPALSWDGAWVGGWDGGDGIRIVIAGNKVTEIARANAYPEILSSEASPEGGMLAVWWVGGDGFLQRTGEREATLSLRERDKPVRNFAVHRE